MIERHLPGSITVDCCWHDGRVYVVRHSPPRLVVESFAPDLSDQREHLGMPMGANAGARICSWADVLWMAYRDEGDFGHLLRMDLAEVYDLGMVGGQRPFAFGDGFCAWVLPDNPMRRAWVLPLGQEPHTATLQDFSDNIPTGLSHVESFVAFIEHPDGTTESKTQGRAVSWDSQRQLEPWGINFVCSGPYLIAQGKHDDGLIGEIDSLAGNLLLWRDALMNDQRLSANGDSCAVIAWQPGAPARLGVVSAADLVTEEPLPDPHVDPLPNKLLMAPFWTHGKYGDTPAADHVGNAIWTDKPADYALFGLPLVSTKPEGPLDSTLVYWVSGANIGELEQRVTEALTWPQKSVIAYLDSDDWPSQKPAGWDARVLPSVMTYRNKDESLKAFDARLSAVLARVASYGLRFVMTPAFYTRNGTVTPDVILECMPLYDRWLREFNICGFMPFADRRPTGMLQHPEFRVWAKAFLDANPGMPDFDEGEEPVPDPELNVRITGFDTPVSRSNPKGGNVTWDEDSARPIKRTIFQMEDGSAAIEFEHTIGTGTDGRYIRGLNYKPVVTGSFHGTLTRIDDQGKRGTARFGPVEVTEDGGGGGPLPPGLIAPNAMWAVQQAMDEHPEIDTTDENARGRILDYACVILNGAPWGRKARNQDGTNKNTDGMCFLRADGKHEIYDSISGHDGSATWDGFGPFEPGENGWWAPHEPV